VLSGVSIGDLIEGRNIDKVETGWGVITKICFWDPPPFVWKRFLFENEGWIGGNAGGYFLCHGPEKGSLGYQIWWAVSYWNYFVGYFVTLLTFGRYKPRLEENFLNCQETVKFVCGLGFHIKQTMLWP
jgi:hypothetical protein